ncbi:hypothetical protein DL240_00170 [Lujinxingia litoralis]|uniref:Glycerophosphoryl diester phosphodiesterase membrane domain-containing protein n=1 Tax=Lujinxingia litoralis TaxID=2211119 RepID=A0A328CAV5_9DELT|nr:hypothetical protein DL240_00170 [Lujinxingia litoralis]
MEVRPPTGIEELGQVFSRLVRMGWGTVLVPWLAIAAIDFLFVAASVALIWSYGATDALAAGGGRGVWLQVLSGLEMAVVLTLRVALLNVLRDLVMVGPSAVGSLGRVFREMTRRLGPVFLVNVMVGAVVAVGLALCVLPGLVALYFLAFAPYLVAVGKAGPLSAWGESAAMARRHVGVLLTGFGVAVLFAGVMACGLGASAAMIQGSAGVGGGLLVGWVLNTTLGYLAWLWWGAVYVTAEQRDQAARLRQRGASAVLPEAPEEPEPPMV